MRCRSRPSREPVPRPRWDGTRSRPRSPRDRCRQSRPITRSLIFVEGDDDDLRARSGTDGSADSCPVTYETTSIPTSSTTTWRCRTRLVVSQSRNTLARHVEVLRIALDTDTPITHRFRRGKRRSGSAERIENDALAERQHPSDQWPEESLRLQARMRRQSPFLLPGRRRADDIPEGTLGRRSPESPGAPLAQVVLNPPLQRLAKHEPGLPHRAGHHADVRELVVCALRTVSATHGHHEPDDLASSFETHCGRAHRRRHARATDW